MDTPMNSCGNTVRDPVYLTVSKVREDLGVERVFKMVSELGLGTVESVGKTTHCDAFGARMHDSYTVYFNTWDPVGWGAEIRQKLQNGETVTLEHCSGMPAWDVNCAECASRAAHEEQKKKPLKHKWPYSDGHRRQKWSRNCLDPLKTGSASEKDTASENDEMITVGKGIAAENVGAVPPSLQQLERNMGVSELCEYLEYVDAQCLTRA